MNYKRILISEAEKKRILGLHNTTKKNPTTRLINEAQGKPNLFPACVRWAGQHVQLPIEIPGMPGQLYAVHVPNAGGKGIDYYWSQETEDGRAMAIVVSGQTDPYEIKEVRSYNCVCKNGRCSAKSYGDDKFNKEHECGDKKPCVSSGDQGGNQKGTIPGGQQGGDCSKGPMDLVVSMGLNWKETQKKWIDSGCMGTQPCSLEEARTKGITNINLRNAICKGTWDPKTGGQKGQTPGGQTPGGQTPTDGEKRFIEPIFPGDATNTPVAD